MIELGSMVLITTYDRETAVVTGYDEDGWPIWKRWKVFS